MSVVAIFGLISAICKAFPAIQGIFDNIVALRLQENLSSIQADSDARTEKVNYLTKQLAECKDKTSRAAIMLLLGDIK